MRQILLELFQVALDAVHGQHCVRHYLSTTDKIPSECIVIAIGKAAQAMAMGCEDVLAEKIVKGLLITKYQHATPGQLLHKWQVIEAAHPVPDQQSLEAGQVLLDFLLDPEHQQHPVIFLISGGASSLVEVLAEEHDYETLQKINKWLLASGLAIAEINQVRKQVSRIKGGKLLTYLEEREVHALLISDVMGDHPHVIGSGLLFPDNETDISVELPGWLDALVINREQTNQPGAGRKINHKVVASNAIARQAVFQAMQDSEYDVILHNEFLEGDATEKAYELADYLLNQAQPGIHIWGGETTVRLPPLPGRGGRNQHFALAAATVLAGHSSVVLLAAGTDGTDGPTEDAGAIVDGGTLSRGELSGLAHETCLTSADSGSFLEASGDLLYTGPTGTNVMDLVIAIKTR